jgi:hypothetical protein
VNRACSILTDADPQSGVALVLDQGPAGGEAGPLACILPIERAMHGGRPPAARWLVVRTALASVTPERPAWLPAAAGAWATYVRTLESSSGWARLAVLPTHDGVISDVPSTLTFLRGHPSWSMVLEPAALLTPEMAEAAEEHLERMGDALAGHAALVGCILPPDDSPLREGVSRWIVPRLPPGVWVARHRAAQEHPYPR